MEACFCHRKKQKVINMRYYLIILTYKTFFFSVVETGLQMCGYRLSLINFSTYNAATNSVTLVLLTAADVKQKETRLFPFSFLVNCIT